MPLFLVHSRLMPSSSCENIQTVVVLFHVDDLYSRLLYFPSFKLLLVVADTSLNFRPVRRLSGISTNDTYSTVHSGTI